MGDNRVLLLCLLLPLSLSLSQVELHSRCQIDCVNEQKCDNLHTLSFSLELFRWTCFEECAYQCYDHIRDPVFLKHEGKWPFYRVS
jgi:hypothetical protein